jgi:hypothetical protein
MASTEKSSSSLRNYIIRDLLVWFALIFLLPALIFTIYYLVVEKNEINVTSNSRNKLDNEQPTAGGGNGGGRASTLARQNGLMKKVSLAKTYPDAVCNDGSPASYYIHLSTENSREWIIVLEGGYFCYDEASCQQRAANSFNLTSSVENRPFRAGHGVLSTSSVENKYWHNANLVSLPYCSSDLWIGNKTAAAASADNEFNFMGYQIIDSLLDELLTVYSMKNARLAVLVGQSAGGIGVLMNANRIQQRLAREAPGLKLKAVIDSSWLLELPYSFLCDNLSNQDCLISRIFLNSIG